MGIIEKEIVMYIVGWLLRWFFSNDKNKKKKQEIEDLKAMLK